MSVKNTHDDYQEMYDEWKKCIDFMTSEKAVHDEGTDYLPQLSTQDDDDYEKYKDAAPVMMFAKRANTAMNGMVMRKSPTITGIDNDAMQAFLDSCDDDGHSFIRYQSKILTRYNTTGRTGTLIDVPYTQGSLTVAQAEEQNIRPFLTKYNELDILNWRVEKINNVNTLVMVVLREEYDKLDGNEFEWDVEYRYRVLDLVDGKYRMRLFDENEALILFGEDKEIFPKMNNQSLPFIPFVFHGGNNVQEPPLNEIVDCNKHHYQLSADEAYGLKMCALPTPYVFGVSPEDENFPNKVGPGVVIGAVDSETKTGFREFSGAGMVTVANKLKHYEQTIGNLSVQFAQGTVDDMSATQANIDQGNSTASLSHEVLTLSDEFTIILKIVADWSRVTSDEVSVQLNNDFMPSGMDANTLNALLQAYVGGAISYDTYYNNLAKGEITDPTKEPEEELEMINQSIVGITE